MHLIRPPERVHDHREPAQAVVGKLERVPIAIDALRDLSRRRRAVERIENPAPLVGEFEREDISRERAAPEKAALDERAVRLQEIRVASSGAVAHEHVSAALRDADVVAVRPVVAHRRRFAVARAVGRGPDEIEAASGNREIDATGDDFTGAARDAIHEDNEDFVIDLGQGRRHRRTERQARRLERLERQPVGDRERIGEGRDDGPAADDLDIVNPERQPRNRCAEQRVIVKIRRHINAIDPHDVARREALAGNEKLTARDIEQHRVKAIDRRLRQHQSIEAVVRRTGAEKGERHFGGTHGARGRDDLEVLPRRGRDQRGAVLHLVASAGDARPGEHCDRSVRPLRAGDREAEVGVGIGEKAQSGRQA